MIHRALEVSQHRKRSVYDTISFAFITVVENTSVDLKTFFYFLFICCRNFYVYLERELPSEAETQKYPML